MLAILVFRVVLAMSTNNHYMLVSINATGIITLTGFLFSLGVMLVIIYYATHIFSDNWTWKPTDANAEARKKYFAEQHKKLRKEGLY